MQITDSKQNKLSALLQKLLTKSYKSTVLFFLYHQIKGARFKVLICKHRKLGSCANEEI